MTAPYKFSPTVQALHLEHLILQRDHLLLVRDRHLQWMGETENAGIREMHQCLADSLEQIVNQYESLIEALRK